MKLKSLKEVKDEAILRAATHGLVLGALWGDGPLPEELEELRNQARAGKCLAVQAASDQSWVERGRTLFGLGHLGASGSSPLSRSCSSFPSGSFACTFSRGIKWMEYTIIKKILTS